MEKKQNEEIKAIRAVVDPWYQSLVSPVKAQEDTLQKLLKRYNQTDYGKNHHGENVGSYKDFKKAFPVQTFDDFKPYFDQVLAGNTHAILSEDPVAFAYTKGTTGKSKMFPVTQTRFDYFVEEILRERYSYSIYKNDFDSLNGTVLLFMASSKLGKIKVGEKEYIYGYTAGVFPVALYKDERTRSNKVVPSIEELSSLSQGLSTKEIMGGKVRAGLPEGFRKKYYPYWRHAFQCIRIRSLCLPQVSCVPQRFMAYKTDGYGRLPRGTYVPASQAPFTLRQGI